MQPLLAVEVQLTALRLGQPVGEQQKAVAGFQPDSATDVGGVGIDPQGNVMAIVLDNCNVSDISPFTGMALQAVQLFACPVEDLSPLKGMPLVELYLEETPVKDISFLSGNTTLQKLYLSSTGVTDLSPLKGLPIVELNLLETHTKDLSPLAGMPIQMLWRFERRKMMRSEKCSLSKLVWISLMSSICYEIP